MRKGLEMVCSGNNGRSPVMRLLAMRRLQEIGTNGYAVDSSGTYVNKIDSLDFSRDEMTPTIDLALQRGMYTPQETSELDTLLRSAEGDLTPYLKKVLPLFIDEEGSYRTRALQLIGLNPIEVQPAKQTIPREDIVAVVTADQSNAERVRKIYAESKKGYKPLIASVSELAGMPEITIVKDRFDFDVYISIINDLVARMPRAVDEVIRATN